MNPKYYRENPRRLHSPLLEGKYKQQIYQPKKEKVNSLSDSELVDSLFPANNKQKSLFNKRVETINLKNINFLEIFFKTILLFILGIGVTSTILELVNIIRNLYYGELYIGESLIKFSISFMVTLISIMLCLGFINLIKIIKFIYLNIKNQNHLIENAISGNLNTNRTS